jgi:hypothetical protein
MEFFIPIVFGIVVLSLASLIEVIVKRIKQ